MTEKIEPPIPSKDLAKDYLKRVNEDVVIERRVKEIANKIDVIFKKVYRYNDDVGFDYTCYFANSTLVFKLSGIKGSAIMFPSLPESCLWDETDLHINLQLLETDVMESYKEVKKIRELESKKPPTLWEYIKSWF